jgi:ANTAR domain
MIKRCRCRVTRTGPAHRPPSANRVGVAPGRPQRLVGDPRRSSREDVAYLREAAKRGVFAYIIDADPEELQNAIDITLQRFTEYHNLQGAFGRRALIEQAKGILMARHAIDQQNAFEMLRDHSQHNGRKLVDVAEAIVESHLLLLPALGNPHAPNA